MTKKFILFFYCIQLEIEQLKILINGYCQTQTTLLNFIAAMKLSCIPANDQKQHFADARLCWMSRFHGQDRCRLALVPQHHPVVSMMLRRSCTL